MEPFTPVVLTWLDAESKHDQHNSVADALEAFRPAYRRSVGYWLGYCKHGSERAVAIATDDDRYWSGSEAVASVFYCPVAFARKVEVIGAPKKRRK